MEQLQDTIDKSGQGGQVGHISIMSVQHFGTDSILYAYTIDSLLLLCGANPGSAQENHRETNTVQSTMDQTLLNAMPQTLQSAKSSFNYSRHFPYTGE